MQEILFIDWLAITCMVVFTLLSFGIFLMFISISRKSGEINKIQLAFMVFFIGMGIARIVLIYFNYFLTHLDPAEFSNHQFFWKFAQVFQLGGIGGLIFVSEKAVFKGKDYFLFLIGFCIFFILAMVHPDYIMSQNLSLVALLFSIFVPISYLYLAFKFPAARKHIVYMFIGFGMFGVGVIMISAGILVRFPTLIHEIFFLSTAIQIPGFIIFGIGIKRMYFTS